MLMFNAPRDFLNSEIFPIGEYLENLDAPQVK